ncbi:hypothetical protein V5799_023095 [Amblyomma americanum]|uniref:Secreted protein n=1 Tax=Amblyomma americanum TaxID=6943 RepID=A0AAQ4FIT2_AMBAM
MARELARRRPALQFWMALMVCFSCSTAAENGQEMRWCGAPLNPWEHAKATKVATDALYSCKDEIKMLNVGAAVIKEAKRACQGIRLCYAFVEETKNVRLLKFKNSNKRHYCLPRSREQI